MPPAKIRRAGVVARLVQILPRAGNFAGKRLRIHEDHSQGRASAFGGVHAAGAGFSLLRKIEKKGGGAASGMRAMSRRPTIQI